MDQVKLQTLLLRLLGFCYFVAFLQVYREVDFLHGPDGVAPLSRSPQRLAEFRMLPWIRAARVFCGSDWAELKAWTAWGLGWAGAGAAEASPALLSETWAYLCALAGMLLGLAVATTRSAHRLPALLLLMAIYHGFVLLGGELFATNGDTLLLECG